MASIQQKYNKYYVVYRAKINGRSEQLYEKFSTEKEAITRKLEIEYQQSNDTFIPTNNQRIAEYLDTFVEIYGTQNWNVNTYTKNIAVIENYIKPLVGSIKLKDFKPIHADKLISDLLATPCIRQPKKREVKCLSPMNVEKIGKLLKTAFNQAEIWELVPKDPFKHTKLPKYEKTERVIWNAETLQKALQLCDDGLLYLAINVAFSASFRGGEIMGLQWKDAFISDEDIENDNAHLIVTKQLQRINKENAKKVKNLKIIYQFPNFTNRETKTCLALVVPKTKSSKRKVWIPRTVAYILRKWKDLQAETKQLMGNSYYDYDLIFAYGDGRPITEGVMNERFKSFIKEHNLPEVVLHSLRHTSTTYKLKLNHGDLKATQGDTGHSTPDMIMKLYAHILDEDRKINASKFEDSFYTGLHEANNSQLKEETSTDEDKSARALLKLIQESPDLKEDLIKILKM